MPPKLRPALRPPAEITARSSAEWWRTVHILLVGNPHRGRRQEGGGRLAEPALSTAVAGKQLRRLMIIDALCDQRTAWPTTVSIQVNYVDGSSKNSQVGMLGRCARC
jgi:hypothetical protein